MTSLVKVVTATKEKRRSMHVSSARIAVSETFESSEGSKKRKTTSKPSPDRRLEVRERCFLSTQMTVCVLISFNVLQEYLRKRGFRFIYGVDEAGRGPLAGPVVAASCCLPDSIDLPGRNPVLFFFEISLRFVRHNLNWRRSC